MTYKEKTAALMPLRTNSRTTPTPQVSYSRYLINGNEINGN